MGRPECTAASACSIGTGRLGSVLARAADAAGIRMTGSWSRSTPQALAEAVEGADVAFVAVPDDAVASVVEQLAALRLPDLLVIVTSGAARLERLAAHAPGLRLVRMHPMQAVASSAPDGVLDGAVAAITAIDPDDLPAVAELARRLGMRPVELDDAHASAWHAAGTMAAGGVVATIAAARDLAVRAGVDPELALDAVAALATSAVAQARGTSPERAITGPVARGDDLTVAAHRRAIADEAPDLLPLYDTLADRAAQVAGRRARAVGT